MNYWRLALICFWAAALVSAFSAQDKPADDTIKVNTALVSVPVIVSDHDGRYIPDLQKEDFLVFQDGEMQDIEFFSATEQPINIAVVIDTSGSTARVLDDIKKAAREFVELLLPTDRAMIISFDGSTHLLCPWTNDSNLLEKGIKRADIGIGGTAMRDALMDTVQNRFKGVEGRKAIILLTDGKDNTSRTSEQRLINVIDESDVTIYPVNFKTVSLSMRSLFPLRGYSDRHRWRPMGPVRIEPTVRHKPPRPPHPHPKPRSTGTIRPGRLGFQFVQYFVEPTDTEEAVPENLDDTEDMFAWKYLNRLADATGGRLFDGKATNFQIFGFVVEELRRQYRLGYYPPEETAEDVVHKLNVGVRRTNIVIRARTTYRPISK